MSDQFEIELPDLTPAAGDNKPPSDAEIALQNLNERLAGDCKAERARAAELLAAAKAVPEGIVDNVAAEALTLLIAQIKTHTDAIETKRKAEKAPFMALAAGVDSFFAAIAFPLTTMRKTLLERLNVYAAAIERQRREEAARLAREAAELAAKAETEDDAKAASDLQRQAQSVAAKPAAQTDYGQTAFRRTVWRWTVTDPKAVPRGYLTVNEKLIAEHIKARPKGKPPAPIAGIEFEEVSSTVVRG